ncbi:MAG TPA: class I SAM-dependent methyltransferase [Nocardioides sp.]|uniref:SAM-dependent methyltransferase n=1 Tax=Nocardioides sp. TaxID=35761 RepID=UPI002D806947|nr:class I SAM-dependent methyltransferase [Nocardioides sp.]HET6653365.1 class I SAM-dependent methyltransferase [Nocardioides sp.]
MATHPTPAETGGAGVRRYYDANTWKFLLTGSQRALHRELWGPGVTTRAEAVHHTHDLVLAELGAADRRVLDLGCGVGTAALYVARRRPVDVVGVSISPAQVRLARRYADRSGPLLGDVRFAVADFTDLPDELTGFDLAFAIESFVHADPAPAFFREVACALRPGGALVVVDDVRTTDTADRRIVDFCDGWHVSSLLTVAEAAALAAGAGLRLVDSRDLSPMQRLGRPRDRVVRALQPVLRRARGRSAWADSMVGGDALQRCHRAGLLEYRLLRFVREAD